MTEPGGSGIPALLQGNDLVTALCTARVTRAHSTASVAFVASLQPLRMRAERV